MALCLTDCEHDLRRNGINVTKSKSYVLSLTAGVVQTIAASLIAFEIERINH